MKVIQIKIKNNMILIQIKINKNNHLKAKEICIIKDSKNLNLNNHYNILTIVIKILYFLIQILMSF